MILDQDRAKFDLRSWSWSKVLFTPKRVYKTPNCMWAHDRSLSANCQSLKNCFLSVFFKWILWACAAVLGKCTVGPIGQKALNKVVSHTDTTLTLPDATRRYQTLPDATRRYQMLTDIIRLSNPSVFFTN
jgi:hypothetical protein